MFTAEQLDLAATILDACRAAGQRLATAESCTGGLIAACLTAVPGCSDVLDCGVVTYSNRAKTALLGVPAETIAQFGAVSEETARAMAEGALLSAPVDFAVAVTGISGPGGGSPERPVGLVHMAVAVIGVATRHERHLFTGDRHRVRMTTVTAALRLLWRSWEAGRRRA